MGFLQYKVSLLMGEEHDPFYNTFLPNCILDLIGDYAGDHEYYLKFFSYKTAYWIHVIQRGNPDSFDHLFGKNNYTWQPVYLYPEYVSDHFSKAFNFERRSEFMRDHRLQDAETQKLVENLRKELFNKIKTIDNYLLLGDYMAKGNWTAITRDN